MGGCSTLDPSHPNPKTLNPKPFLSLSLSPVTSVAIVDRSRPAWLWMPGLAAVARGTGQVSMVGWSTQEPGATSGPGGRQQAEASASVAAAATVTTTTMQAAQAACTCQPEHAAPPPRDLMLGQAWRRRQPLSMRSASARPKP
eukprot:312713-Chlamydomonas_euryale.AAC.3